MWGKMPLDVPLSNSSENFRLRPNVLEACDKLLPFLLISCMSKQFFIRLHSAINSIPPRLPEDNPQMKMILSERNLHTLTPNSQEYLGSEDIPRVSIVSLNEAAVSQRSDSSMLGPGGSAIRPRLISVQVL